MRISMSIGSLALVAALAVAPFAWAQGTGSGSGSAPSTSAPAASPATSASPSSSDFVGRHTMSGEVTQVDTNTGKFSLKTGEGTLELHAPPAALSGVKPGDQMSVEIAVKPMN